MLVFKRSFLFLSLLALSFLFTKPGFTGTQLDHPCCYSFCDDTGETTYVAIPCDSPPDCLWFCSETAWECDIYCPCHPGCTNTLIITGGGTYSHCTTSPECPCDESTPPDFWQETQLCSEVCGCP